MKRPFFRLETYALEARLARIINGKERRGKRSVMSIAREADRVAEHIPHVPHPQAPRLLHGQNAVLAVMALIREVALAKEEHLRRTGSKLKVRKDQQLVVAGVVSYPTLRHHVEADEDLLREYRRWRKRVVRYLRQRFNNALKCVLEHSDEPYPHLHFFSMPDVASGELNLARIHPGIKASVECGPRGAVPFEVRRYAWRRGMRTLQLDFFLKVSFWFGHTLRNSRKQRLTREQSRAQKQQLEALSEARRIATDLLLAADAERLEAKKERVQMLKDLMAERQRDRATLAAALSGVDEARRRLEAVLEFARHHGIQLPPEIGEALKDVSNLVGPS